MYKRQQYTLSVSAVDAEGNELSSVEHGGRVLDLYSDPYTGHAIVNGKGGSEASIGLSMSPPENQDWWKIRLYKDGQMVKEHMREDKDLPSASEAEGCDVVLVDYSGNVSEPVSYTHLFVINFHTFKPKPAALCIVRPGCRSIVLLRGIRRVVDHFTGTNIGAPYT